MRRGVDRLLGGVNSIALERCRLEQENRRVLVINPGSTSTKLGVYSRQGAEWVRSIRHGDEELKRFGGLPMVARLGYRAGLIQQALAEAGYLEAGSGQGRFAAVAGRGGLLPQIGRASCRERGRI